MIAATAGGRRLVVLATAFACAAPAGVVMRTPTRAGVGALALVAGAAGVARALRVPGALGAGALGLVIALGVLRGALAVPQATALDPFVGTGPVSFRGTVSDGVVGSSPVVDIDTITGGGGEAASAGAVELALQPGGGSAALEPGDHVEVTSTGLHRPGRRPGAGDATQLDELGITAVAGSSRATLLSSGGFNPARVLLHARQRLTGGVEAVLPEPIAPLLLGIVVGVRRSLPAGLTAALQDTGLIHIMVVSGVKVSILAGMLRRACDAAACSYRVRLLTVVPAIGAYVAMSGAGSAAVRSAVMGVAALVLSRGGRRADTVPLLAVTAAAMVAVSPSIAREVGFQLSFLGTLGIVMLAGPIGDRLPGPRLLVDPFAVTIAAQLATFPLMASVFGVIALVAPLANALVLPLLPALIVLGGIGAALAVVAPALGWLPLQLAGLGVQWTTIVAVYLARVPGVVVRPGAWPVEWTIAALGITAAGGAAALSWRRDDDPHRPAPPGRRMGGGQPPRPIAALTVGLVVVAAGMLGIRSIGGDGVTHITVLDVGAGGSAVMIRSPHGGIALVDAGASPAAVDTALGRVLPMTVHTIDLLVLTGGERATAGGLTGVSAHHRVARIVVFDGDVGTATRTLLVGMHDAGTNLVIAAIGGGFVWDGLSWRCLPVPPTDTVAVQPLCAIEVGDRQASAVVLGGVAAPVQEELAAVGDGFSRVAVLVTDPGGATAPALVDALRPMRIGVPGASSAAKIPTGIGPGARSTAIDGDLEYTLGAAGAGPP